MSWLEQKYVGLLSPRLERFKRSGSGFLFRCPFCGDSQKSKSKARGNIWRTEKGDYRFSCFNCGLSYSFNNFIKTLDPTLFSEYKLEKLKESGFKSPEEIKKTFTIATKVGSSAQLLSSLSNDHPAVQYCLSRNIPVSKLNRIKYTDNLKRYLVDEIKAEKYADRNIPEDKRIIFEMCDADKNVFGFQARVIGTADSRARFITIKLDDAAPKIYGLDSVNFQDYPVFVTEGIIDSLFLPNCLALCGGDVNVLGSVLKSVPKQKVHVCLDNEPRHKDTVSRMQSAIDMGYNVMFWDYESRLKDINEMIKSGITTRDILTSIKNNSKRGASAKIALSSWKKV